MKFSVILAASLLAVLQACPATRVVADETKRTSIGSDVEFPVGATTDSFLVDTFQPNPQQAVAVRQPPAESFLVETENGSHLFGRYNANQFPDNTSKILTWGTRVVRENAAHVLGHAVANSATDRTGETYRGRVMTKNRASIFGHVERKQLRDGTSNRLMSDDPARRENAAHVLGHSGANHVMGGTIEAFICPVDSMMTRNAAYSGARLQAAPLMIDRTFLNSINSYAAASGAYSG